VRVRTRGPLVDPELKKYENMRGTVIGWREVVGYMLQPGLAEEPETTQTAVVVYSVEMEHGFRLDDLFEFCLELAQSS
jgi:hypothetical protein